jgi:hypothetical protein
VPALALASLVACGGKVKDADEQIQGKVDVPVEDADPNAPFALTEERGSYAYQGSVILWNDAATPAQIQRVSEASVGGRRLKSGMIQFVEAELAPARAAVAPAEAKVRKAEDEIATVVAERKSDKEFLRETIKPLASGWFPGRLAELRESGTIDAAAEAHAKTMFDAYCEYKLWELALSPLAHLSYKVRPTPLEFCESYYAAAGYFANEGRCGDSADSERAGGKKYFACLWHDGVLKSALLTEAMATTPCFAATVPADGYPSRRAALDAWLESGLLQATLADKTLCDEGSGRSCAELLSEAAVQGSGATPLKLRSFPGYEEYKRCPMVFKRTDYADPTATTPDWRTATLNQLKAIGEQADAGAAGPFVLLPGEGAVGAENWEKLGNHLAKFSERALDESLGYGVSYSDSQFNFPQGGEILTPKPEYDAAVRDDAVFKQLFDIDRLLVPTALKEARDERVTELAAAKAEVAKHMETRKTWEERIQRNVGEGVEAVRDENATRFFAGWFLQVARAEDRLVVAIRIGDGKELRGCVGTRGTACTLAAEELGKAAELAPGQVAYDAATGKLSVELSLAEPALVGFGPVDRATSPLYFNDFAPADLAFRRLVFEVYGSRLGDSLDFITGNVSLYAPGEGGRKEASGSFSGDNWNQRLSLLEGASRD